MPIPLHTIRRLYRLRSSTTFFCTVIMIFMMQGKTEAYIMPAEQILGLMTLNFAKFNTLVITQSTHLITSEDSEVQIAMQERIWLKSPGFLYSEMIGPSDAWESIKNELRIWRPAKDMAFHRLFLGHDESTLMALLSEMGVNLNSVAFTRLDGHIAYRLGDEDADAPKLVIEKDRFLPLLLNYNYWGDSEWKSVTVRFHEYRKLAEGWFPHEISFFAGDIFEERYFITDLEVNALIDVSFFEQYEKQRPPFKMPEDDRQSAEDKRIREIIEILRERYRQTNSSIYGH